MMHLYKNEWGSMLITYRLLRFGIRKHFVVGASKIFKKNNEGIFFNGYLMTIIFF